MLAQQSNQLYIGPRLDALTASRQAAPPFQQRTDPPSTRRPCRCHVPHEPRGLATQRLCTSKPTPPQPSTPWNKTSTPSTQGSHGMRSYCRMASTPNRHRTLRPVDQRLTAPTPPRHSRESGNPSLFLLLSASSVISAVNLPPHRSHTTPSPSPSRALGTIAAANPRPLPWLPRTLSSPASAASSHEA